MVGGYLAASRSLSSCASSTAFSLSFDRDLPAEFVYSLLLVCAEHRRALMEGNNVITTARISPEAGPATA